MKKFIALTLLALACAPATFAGDVPRQRATPETTAEPSQTPDDGEDVSDFVEAVKRGDAAAVRKFLAAGMSPDGRRDAVLLRAVRGGNAEVVRLLLDAGADPEVHDGSDTPLMLAAVGATPQVVRLLVEHGADVNARDDDGHSVLFGAAVAAALADLPPGVRRQLYGEEEDDPGQAEVDAVLARATKKDRLEILRTLLDAGADVNAVADDCSFSPLMTAAMYGSPEVARLLLDRGADPNVGAKDRNPLLFATFTLEELLKDLTDDPERATEEAKAAALAFHNATRDGRAEVADMLRRAGARETWEWPEVKDEEEAPDDEKPKDAPPAPPDPS